MAQRTCQYEHLLAQQDVVGDEVSRGEQRVLPVLDLHHFFAIVVIVQDLGEA